MMKQIHTDRLDPTEEQKARMLAGIRRRAEKPHRMLHPRRVLCVAAAAAVLCSTTALAVKNNWLNALYPSTDPTEVEPLVQSVENSIHKDGMTFTVEAMLGDRYNVLLVYTLSRDDGQPLTTDTDIVDWLCYDNYSIVGEPDAFTLGSSFMLDDDPSDGTLQFAQISYAKDFDSRAQLPMAGQTLRFQSIDVFYETPNPDFVLYGDEAKYDTTFVFSSETEFELPLDYEDATVRYAGGQTIEKGGIRSQLHTIYLSPISCTIDLTWSFQADVLTEPYSTSFQLKLKDGTVWDGADNRLANGYIDAVPVTKTQTFDDQKNWVFDRIIPVEDVQSIIYDGVEIPLQRAE